MVVFVLEIDGKLFDLVPERGAWFLVDRKLHMNYKVESSLNKVAIGQRIAARLANSKEPPRAFKVQKIFEVFL